MKIRTAAAAALTLAAALALAGCADGSGSQSMPGMDHGSSSSPSSSSTVTADFNDADVMFAQMMIPHHQQAVEMADMILNKEGIDPGVLTLASDIKAAQQPEIDQLQSWLDEWGADMPDMDSMEGMDHGGGMMSEDDMAALEAATGAEASRLFLEQMTMHHEGAIEMAQDEVDNGQNPDAVEMAQTIVDTQTAEIAQMQELLAQL
ncbi:MULTISPECIES: DUF305 domain-containing protein [Microbacterium]|uniref:DUF305 domain-containing protein n=1 Tax=Microbacterium TaxID=33882 RepID=UPI000DF7DBE2|nr:MULTISPECIES: DUF305 domain-containing protein [Microbacterium]MBP2420784.1 uncharacterized protein (DUF305 family) [Microbacterium imperiale]MDS0200094.1 DUF305 domain-containing protein [Microbacterium imperiale]WRK17195.1 DUF305 domain-containing protein [Microbacterium plantarum]BFE41125.1 DUF305 domain-containing protein [Microbacterium imperiale]